MSYVQKFWKISWKKKEERGDFWAVVGSQKDADRFERILKGAKDVEWVKVTDPSLEPTFKVFSKS